MQERILPRLGAATGVLFEARSPPASGEVGTGFGTYLC
jgi:hypothetical protein